MADLKNKVAVITGGGGILGSEMAMELARNGARVVVLGRSLNPLEEVISKIKKAGGSGMAISCDVLDKVSLLNACKEVDEKYGPCDILINGAGGNHPDGTTSKEYFMKEYLQDNTLKTFFNLDLAGIEYVFNLNFLGTFLPIQVFSKAMVGRENACIINISSMSAYLPLTQIPAYSAAKAAVSNFTQWLAVHFSKVGIRVNAIAPGFFVTRQNVRLLTNEDGSLTKRGSRIISQTPMERFGEPSDLNSTLLYLCDPGSAFVTGIVVPVDGGFSAYSGV